MTIDEASIRHDLETLSKADFLKKYPKSRFSDDLELVIEVLGDEFGRHRAEIDADIATLRADMVRGLRSVESDMEGSIAALNRSLDAYQRQIGDLRRQIGGLTSEIDLLRQLLPLGSRSVEVGDAVKLLRQTAGVR